MARRVTIGSTLATAVVVVLGLTVAAAAPADSRTFTVDTQEARFIDTGLALRSGSALVLSASGNGSCDAVPPLNPTVCPPNDPNGSSTPCSTYGDCPAPSLNIGSVVGRLNNGAPFLIGKGPVTIKGPGELFLAFNDAASYLYDNRGTFTVTATTVTVAKPPGSTSAKVVSVVGDVGVRHGAGDWQDLAPGTALTELDSVATGPDSQVVLQFSDGSQLTLQQMSQILIGTLLNKEGRDKIAILLRIGALKAKVVPQATLLTDFSVKSPTATVSVRGTVFSVYYDPSTGATIADAIEHSVLVTPSNSSLPPVTISAGKEVEVTPKVESPVASIGRAGAPAGGVNEAKAVSLTLAVVGAHTKTCGFTQRGNTYRAQRTATGWQVSVKLAGRVHGWSTWTVTGTRVTPLNKLAKRTAAGCH